MDDPFGTDAQKRALEQQRRAERNQKIDTIQDDVGRRSQDLFRLFSRGMVFGGSRSSGQPPIIGM